MTATDLELVWDDSWDAPVTPKHHVRVFHDVRLHNSTDLHGKPVHVDVETVAAGSIDGTTEPMVAVTVTVGREVAVWDTTTEHGRAALVDLVAALNAALVAGAPCEGCGVPAATECGPDCLSYQEA